MAKSWEEPGCRHFGADTRWKVRISDVVVSGEAVRRTDQDWRSAGHPAATKMTPWMSLRKGHFSPMTRTYRWRSTASDTSTGTKESHVPLEAGQTEPATPTETADAPASCFASLTAAAFSLSDRLTGNLTTRLRRQLLLPAPDMSHDYVSGADIPVPVLLLKILYSGI